MSADLSALDTFIFDLDNTLYPVEAEVMALVEERMTLFVMREAGVDREGAVRLRDDYRELHGATLAGMMAHHGVDPAHFLNEVHDISLDSLTPDPDLRRGLERLPGRRLVFTNGGAFHAERVLERLAIADLFDAVFHLEAASLVPKPNPQAYADLVRRHAVTPRRAVFFEDSERNLRPAAELGMTTVLVGPNAPGDPAPFVDYRAERLAPFLLTARLASPAAASS